MKRKSTILRLFALLALMLPWTLQAQNAKVSEYDGSSSTATYSSIVSTGTAQTFSGNYVDVQMPFNMYFGTTQVTQGSTLRIWKNGSVTFDGITGLADARIAPLYLDAGYTTTQVYTKNTNNQMFTVEWRKVVSGTNSYSFQLKLYSNGDIEFCYGPMTINSSISVLVGMMSSSTDIYRVGGSNNGSAWDTIYRNITGTTPRTLSSTYAPAYDITTGIGMVYSFTQPACVKPTSLTATALAWNSIKLDWKISSPGNGFEIKYSTDAAFDPDVAGTSKTVNNGADTTYTLTGSGLQGNTTYYFYVRKVCSGTPSGWSPMATASTPSGCPTLSGINSTNVTATGATLYWSTSVAASSFNVRYNLGADFDPDNNEGTLITTNDTSKVLTGLTGSSTYYYYVRANCVSGLTTIWYGPYTFNTACGAIAVSANNFYTQTFAGTIMPSCWSEEVLAGTSTWSYNDGYTVFPYTNGAKSRLITPVLNFGTGDYQVDFYHAECNDGSSQDSLYVYYRTSATGDWVLLQEFGNGADYSNITLSKATILLPNTNSTYQLAFEGQGHNGYRVYLANVVVRTQPTCPAPTGLAATNAGVVSWTASTNNTNYDILYGLAGFTSVEEGTLIENVTGTTYTIAGLAGSTSYDIYIRAHCSATNEISEGWVGPASFTTPCAAVTSFPWNEDFESFNASSSGVTLNVPCWVNEHISGSGSYFFEVYSGTNGSNSTKQLRLRDMSSGTMTKLMLPLMNLPSNNYRFVLDVYRNTNSSSYAGEGIRVFASTNGEIEGATELAFISRKYNQANGIIPAESASGWYTYELPIGISGNCYIIIRGESKYGSHTYMDNFVVEQIPTCLAPTNLAAVPTATSAELSWTENSGTPATQWEVRYWNGTDTISVIANANPYTLNYLAIGAAYNWQVRSLCSAEDKSVWSVVDAFNTNCLANTETTADGTVTYTMASGNNPDLTLGEHGAIIYDDGGASGDYSNSQNQYLTIYPSTTGNKVHLYDPDASTEGSSWDYLIAYNGVGTGGTQLGEVRGMNQVFDVTSTDATGAITLYFRSDGSVAKSGWAIQATEISCDMGECVPPTVAIMVGPDGDNAKADLTFSGDEDVYGYIYGPAGFTPNIANGVTVNGNTATITPLAQETTFDLYVYSVCTGVSNPNMVRYSFTTPFVPTCKPQVNYATSNVTYTGATVTWQQEDPTQVPESWTLRYAVNAMVDLNDPSTYTEENIPGATTGTYAFSGLHNGDIVVYHTMATCNAAQNDFSEWSAMQYFQLPVIAAPTALTNWATTNSTDSLSWTEATEGINSWTVRYNAGADFDPDGTEGQTITATTTKVELTGLEAYTKYYVYVRANSGDEHSAWSAVATFKTKCPDGGEIALGDRTSTNSYLPYYKTYNYSLSEQIYTADELGAATTISSLSYEVTSGNAAREAKIYLGHTSVSSFSSASNAIATEGMTLVFDGEMPANIGWNTIDFTTNFAYDGTSNLVVVVQRPYHLWNEGTAAAFGVISTATPQAMYSYSDNYEITPNNVTSGTNAVASVKNNFIFGANCNTDVTCFAPATVGVTVADNNNVAVTWTARTDLRPIVNNFELKYGFVGFDPDVQGAGTLVSNLNNVFNYNITASLEYDYDYDVYVRTVCGENDYSDWTKASFHTNPFCWAPDSLRVTITSDTSVTLTWAETTPTAATRWEVVYGLPGFDPDRATPLQTTSKTYEVKGLRHTTKYEFYVRAVCDPTASNGRSPWSAVTTGTTQCGVWQYEHMPLVENFDGVTGTTSSTINSHVLPNCWDYINTSTTTSGTSTTGYPGYPIAYNGASTSHSGNNHMRFYTYTTAAYGDQYAILPQFGFDLDTAVVGFYAREDATTANHVGVIVVGVMSDPDNAATFVAVDTVLPTTTSYTYFEVSLSEYEGAGRYIALKAPKPTTGYNAVYLDDLTVKLREKINVLADAGDAIAACNEFVMPDTATLHGTYNNNINATYVIHPATPGKVAHITGDYDLEYGYDYLNVYRGAVNANNLVARYTGNGTIDYKTGSNLWADSGYVTLVFTTDNDNALPYTGFKLLVSCEDPNPGPDSTETIVENGTYTWRNGETYTNNVVRTGLTYDPANQPLPDLDRDFTALYTYKNVAGVDSVTYHMALTLHPTYNLTYNATICERDTFTFYGNNYTATNNYTVNKTSQYGADSTGVLVLQVNPAPSAAIYKGGDEVTEITDYCDKADLTLLARSNADNATFVWEDNSTAASRVVNPHESNTYTVVATNPTTGCTSLPASVTVTTTPVPALTISGDAEICYGQSATLTLTDANNVPATYRWSTGATTTSITVNPTVTTTYSVTATTSNASACTATAEFTVMVNALPVVTATASVGETCRDSVVTLTATEVEGYTYSWNTGATTAVATTAAVSTGAYTVTVTDQKGCVNEFNTATVTVYPSYEMSDSLKVCFTYNPYTWGAQPLTANGEYDQNFTIAHGCDSLVHLTFTFEEMGVENSNIERCYGDSYTFENITRTANADTTLFYIDNSGECPVRYNLAVTVNPVKATALEQTVCDTYTWPVSGETYTATGAYPYTLATTKGCDSVVTMNLTVNYQNTGVETVTACDNYVWDLNGVNYTATTNEPTFTLQNQWGCDSVVTLNLTVNYRSYHEDFHCVSNARNFTWLNGRTYNLNVNIADSIQFVTGTNDVQCNEIALLHLVMNPVLDTLAWANVEACDEYVVDNAVVIDSNCAGVVEPMYLRETGDYEIRTRNATTGQDQWTRIHLTITPSTYHTTVATACLPYTWTILDADSNIFEVATITAEMVNGASPFNMSVDLAEAGFVASTCSSIEVLRLTPKYPSEVVDTIVTICANGIWTAENNTVFNGADYATGIYIWDNSTLNADGCQLTRKVNLTVNPVYVDSASLTFCESEFVNDSLVVVNVNNDTQFVALTIPGALNDSVYTNTVIADWTTALGCDSMVTIVYTVNPTRHFDVYDTACYAYTWDLNGETYKVADGANQTDMFATEENGCRVETTLHITLNDTVRGYVNNVVCTSYEYNGVTYRTDKTFVEKYDGELPISNGCDSVTYISFHIQQTELIHQYVLSNRPYTWKNGQTFSQSVENVYFDEPSEGDCGNVYSLHLNMLDPIVFCDNAFPYNTGINGITLEDGNRVVDTASFCLNNPYYTSIGRSTGNVLWGTKFNANRTADWYNVFGANLYYVNNYPGTYTLKIYAGGDTLPATLVGTKTVTFDANEATGWKYFQLDQPVVSDGQNLWVTFDAGDVTYPASCVQYFDASDQNGAWVSGDGGVTWESLNENNNTLFFSFMIKTVYSANMWRNNDPNGNDTILYYTVNPTYNTTATVDTCDSYTWEGTTYTTSGNYNVNYTSAEGCDSVLNLNLTVRNSNTASVEVTVCDSYTWAGASDSTYTATGAYTYTTTNAAGCDSVVTLNLTINKNDGVEVTVSNGCDSYTWDRTGLTYDTTGDYTKTFADANGCLGDSVLHLTINPSYETYDTLVVNEGGSYTYLGVMYSSDNGAVDTTITHTFQSIYGCDSINHLRLIIPVLDDIVEVNVEACGTYTWAVADGGTGHTYSWIPMSERQSHGMALYRDITANKYVYTYPMDTTFDANHVMTQVRVLHLNLLEATTSEAVINVPVSLGSYTIDGDPDDVTVTFNFDSIGTPIIRTVGVGSVEYCNDYRTFTINVFNNYDTTEVFACADATTYTWNNETYTIGTPAHTFYFVQKDSAGTLNELVHVLKVNQRAVNAETMTETACDSYTWAAGDSLTYTNSVTGVVYNYTDANGCAATKTLNLTIKHNTSLGYTADVCDTYTWTRNNQVYTATGDYTYSYTDTNNCAAVDTLHLTIRNNTNTTFDTAVCVSYTWTADKGGDGNVYDSTAAYTYEYTATNGCPSVNTLNLTINMPTSTGETLVTCDSTEWHGTKYYTSGTYYYNYNTTAGCASVDTLYLTVNNATYSSETLTQCDSYVWNGTTYTTSGVYTNVSTNAAGCQNVDTLHLTINVNTNTVHDTIVACDEFTWDINSRLYNTSGNYTASTTDSITGCATTNTLNLTINHTSSYDSVLYISDGSYRYYGQNATELFGEGVYNRSEHYTNVAGCDSTLNITFNIGTALLGIDNVVFCNEYTWRNGETYVWISDEERAANLNNENDAPLYKTSTGTYIYYNPTYTVVRENAYDSIYMLALTLTQSAIGTDDTTINISNRQVTYGDSTFHFDANADSLQFFTARDVEFDVHFAAVQHCDSIITLTVHLVNNYQEAEVANICVTETNYTWRGHTITTATNDYDHAHTYYVYDTLASGVIEYATVNQHPLVYATERRTACDSYTWNGNTYTESTSNATAYFPAGTIINGEPLVCDSTVTLILTINKNSSTKFTASACESYKWVPTKAADSANYTVSGTYYSPVYYTAKGCASVDTLELIVNYKTSTAYVVDSCDSYTWTNGTGNTYTASDTFYYSYTDTMGICTSTDTLYLTIRKNSNKTYTKVVCDNYTWADTLGGNGEVYTATGTYTYDYNAVNGCPSTNTLNLTVNKNSGHKDVIVACDSALWHGTMYYANNNTATYDYADANTCPSVDTLNLTINQATHSDTTVIACQTFTWHGSVINNPSSVGDIFYNDYTYNYTNAANCASTETLHLTLGGGRTFSTQTVTNCGPYTWIVNGENMGTIDESTNTSSEFLNPRTGCDSVVFLNLTILEAPETIIPTTICNSELPYTWTNGDSTRVLTEAGEATVIYPFSATCDSTVRLVLTVNPVKETALTDQICLGKDYTANGFDIAAEELAIAGEYTFTANLTSYQNCDSVVTLTLTVGDVINNPVEATACDSYAWDAGDGHTYNYTASGTYNSEAYANAQGCTTVDVLTLTINVNAGTVYNQTICDAYMWNGTQYTETGDYTYAYTDGNGCASVDTLHLTVNNSVINNIVVTACDSYTWENGNGEIYTVSGAYTYNYTTTDGCTGIDNLVLTINTNTNTEYTETACDSYVWNDTEYTESGDYEFEYDAANGCPSKDVLHLTVNKSTTSEETAESCSFYNWHGETYTTSGDYTYVSTNDDGCQNTATLHLTINNPVAVTIDTTVCGYFNWNGIRYNETDVITHNFTAANGCDSIETINLTVNSTALSVATATACDSYTWDVNGSTYTQSGNYIAILEDAAVNGCDSMITLVVTINNSIHNTESVTACDSYTWNGTPYTTSGTYTYAYNATNGCPSVDTLNLTVNNSTTGSENVTACNYYLWNGNAYTQSGTYTSTLTGANGCDSVATLNLTIGTVAQSTVTATSCNAYTWNGNTYTQSGAYTHTFTGTAGCDSVVTLLLTISQAMSTTLAVTACDSYTWNGVTYANSGNYSNTYSATNGCDSIVTLALTINNSTASTVNATACDSYTWRNGQTYTASTNTPTTTIVNAAGCDSVITLHLTINNSTTNTINATACDSYTWNNTNYTTSGNYTQTYPAANGCDSTVTLNLTIQNATNATVSVTACDSYTWINGQTYTTSTNTPTVTLVNAHGCDSIVTLNLTINNGATGVDNQTACESYTWIDGQTYTVSTNTPTYTLTAANGCDSVVTLNLTVNYGTTGVDNQTACGSYTWIDGETYTASTNTPTYTLPAANGCDSVVTLNLTINNSYDIIDQVSACDGFIWIDNVNYTESTNTPTVTLQAMNGCDSVVTLHLTINHSVETYDTVVVNSTDLPYYYGDYTFNETGDYALGFTTVNGCDSTVYLHFEVNVVGINTVSVLDDLVVYPNPTRGGVTLTADKVVKVEVLDIVGRCVATFEGTNTFDISNLAQGSYTLRITLPEGVTVRKVVKK